MNSNWRRKNSGLPRGRGGRGVWGEFRRARTFRRSEAEAVSSLQKMFEQSCIIPPTKIPKRWFDIFVPERSRTRGWSEGKPSRPLRGGDYSEPWVLKAQ